MSLHDAWTTPLRLRGVARRGASMQIVGKPEAIHVSEKSPTVPGGGSGARVGPHGRTGVSRQLGALH